MLGDWPMSASQNNMQEQLYRIEQYLTWPPSSHQPRLPQCPTCMHRRTRERRSSHPRAWAAPRQAMDLALYELGMSIERSFHKPTASTATEVFNLTESSTCGLKIESSSRRVNKGVLTSSLYSASRLSEDNDERKMSSLLKRYWRIPERRSDLGSGRVPMAQAAGPTAPPS